MANWGKISSRGNVDDRRGMAPLAIGGISATTLAIILIFNIISGGDIGDILGTIQNVPVQNTQTINSAQYENQDSYEIFASTVLGSNNDIWNKIFSEQNSTYIFPKLVLFRIATESECGTATSEIGPHYCPLDQTIYLDETFFDELTSRFGARGGDVAQAYVISHEVGHHVQNILGIMETQSDSIEIELQADCFAGLWANSISSSDVLLPNEIEEAMDAAAAVGDDRIQKSTIGYINQETWTHGSSAQRVAWFNSGYESGSFSTCDTFNN